VNRQKTASSYVVRFVYVFASAIALAGVAAFAARAKLESQYKAAAHRVCSLVAENYHRRFEPEIRAFVSQCHREAENQEFLSSRAANIDRVNDRLEALRTSHLAVYSPVENRQMWDNRALDTGLRSRMVEDHLVVFRILPGSAGEKAGFKPGDSILSVNGHEVGSSQLVQSSAGLYRILRAGAKEIEINLEPEEMQEDMNVELRDLGRGNGLLRIPSFLSQYFDKVEVQSLAQKLSQFDHLVIDLRDNAGGSFPAMLRALSPFRCDSRLVGWVARPASKELTAEQDLLDDLDAKSQLEQLNSSAKLHLRTFTDYGCYKGRVTVLIDSGTSSVAEIFAQSFFSRPRSRVWGQPSAGQVVMAQWFPLGEFGSDAYSLAIPIARYESNDGAVLEDKGVYPELSLFYDLESSLKGRDSWIDAALKNVSF
jgi:C-terminal processing protease CtpA/Prc